MVHLISRYQYVVAPELSDFVFISASLSSQRQFYSFCFPAPPPPPVPLEDCAEGWGDVRLSTLDKWSCFDSSTLYSNVSALVDSEFINNAGLRNDTVYVFVSAGSIVLRIIHDL